jgi:hypothetical protein
MPESLDDIKQRVQQKLITPNYSKAIVLNPDEVSQYDQNFIIPLESDWRSARQEEMAQAQPGIDQLANGVIKGAGLAATTFADTFGGTVFGIGNMIAKGAAGDIESGGDLLNAFVNNIVSNLTSQIASDSVRIGIVKFTDCAGIITNLTSNITTINNAISSPNSSILNLPSSINSLLRCS